MVSPLILYLLSNLGETLLRQNLCHLLVHSFHCKFTSPISLKPLHDSSTPRLYRDALKLYLLIFYLLNVPRRQNDVAIQKMGSGTGDPDVIPALTNLPVSDQLAVRPEQWFPQPQTGDSAALQPILTGPK